LLNQPPLAVELSSFTAVTSGDSVIIRWRTESEIDNVGFTIYRGESKDSGYTKIAFIPGAEDSETSNNYQFTDEGVEAGKTYFYYLEDVDLAGEKSKSELLKVVVPAKSVMLLPSNFALLQNYPNPFNPESWLPYQLAEDSAVSITIYDLNCKVVKRLHLGKQRAGFYTTKGNSAYWNGTNSLGQKVSSGFYFYTLHAGDFSATRKMVILK